MHEILPAGMHMDSEGKAPEEWATTEAACFLVKDHTATSPGRGAQNKQMTPSIVCSVFR